MPGWSEWFLNNALEIVVLVFGGLYAVAKVREGMKQMTSELIKIANRLDAHMAAEFPHGACRLEQQKIDTILESIRQLTGRFDVLDERIVELIRQNSKRQL